jgi:PAS domain S-box-containing protein
MRVRSKEEEAQRIAVLQSYNILDTFPEQELDALTAFASSTCGTPISMITLVDSNRLWYKSSFGIDVQQAPLEAGYCKEAIDSEEIFFEIQDTFSTLHHADNILAKSDPKVRFYAGCKLITPGGITLGTICVMDTKPRALTAEQKQTMQMLANFVMTHFALRKSRYELDYSKSKYHSMIENAGDIIYTCNLDGRFTYINKQFEKMLGLNGDDFSKTHFTGVIAQEWKGKVISFYEKQLTQRIPETVFCFPLITKDGSRKWVEQTVTLNFKNGQPVSFMGIVRDINTRKQEEEQIAKVMKAKENFLANISHEIRTPLNATIGFTDLLLNTKLSTEQTEFVHAIESSGKNLLALINDILDYSKIEAGMLTIEKVPLDIRKIFNTLSLIFKDKAKRNNNSVYFETESSIANVISGDPVRLTQILTNLVSNAIKFTPNGTIKVKAELMNQNNGKIYIRFTVADNGIGIHPDMQQQIFERFNQATNSTSRKYGGTGLGLSIVKSLVELHQGTIKLDSKPGEGSTFTVVLPFEETNELPATEPAPIYRKKNAARGIRILLAEDNHLNQKLAIKSLEAYGFDTYLARDGKEALKILRKEKFDLILMDMQMPEMDGYTAITVIRKEMGITIPVIAMTAHAFSNDKARCLELGMNDYMSKPFRAEELFHKIMALVPAKRRSRLHPRTSLKKTKKEETSLDMSKVKKLSAGDNHFVIDVLDIFINDTSSELKKIKLGIREHDHSQIKRSAHTLKSSTHLFGLHAGITTAIENVEKIADDTGSLTDIERFYKKLNSGFLKAIRNAKEERQKLKNS